jgi:hypothetical protein
MRDYRFDFANGTTDLVEIFAVRCGYVRYYELLSGGGVDQRIRVESMGGGWAVVLRPGQGFRLPAEETAGIVITNISGTAMAGTLKLGPRDWQFEDQRLIGEVSVIDGGLTRTRSNQAFMGVSSITTSTAANMAGVQLWNNAAIGGRLLVVSQIIMHSSFAGTVGYTLRIEGSPMSNPVASQSKMITQAASAIAQIRTVESGSWGASPIGVIAAPQGNHAVFRASEPIVLAPQTGLLVTDSVTSAVHTTTGTFEHYEVTQ